MSTQHPDNVNTPFFAHDTVLGGEDEIQEAYYVFSHLGCDEQMWDCEGKEVDNFVVKKLLTRYETFFREKVLGRDVFLTLRVPNPTVEKAEAKILLETLESIPRSYDAAHLFYGEDIPPVFEVILPMTASPACIDRVYRYYSDFVAGKQKRPFFEGDITIAEWIGEFKPETIEVIPLFEDLEHMLAAPEMVRAYLSNKKVESQRVFLARSDPAMNYGLISAVLMNKLALARFRRLEEETGVRIFPIIGVGSAPFRGNMKPGNAEDTAREYPSAHTFTIQSSFKYDHSPAEVCEAVRRLSERRVKAPQELDEGGFLDLIERYSAAYRQQLTELAPLINQVARFMPPRRKRKLHIGLFGYAREREGVRLPRAISFTCALYSIGLPPEIIGFNALTLADLQLLDQAYVNMDRDLQDALAFFNPSCLDIIPGEVSSAIREMSFPVPFRLDEEHREITGRIISDLRDGKEDRLAEYVLMAAHRRRFLG